MRLAPSPVFTARLSEAPSGDAGFFHTIRTMRALVRAARIDPFVINTAVSIIHAEIEHDKRAEAAALFRFVRDSVRFVSDVAGLETLSDPRMTLQRMVGDCDDQATLLAALLESVGYPTRFVMAGYQTPMFEHVYLQTWVDGEWINCDPTQRYAFGEAPPAPLALWFEKV